MRFLFVCLCLVLTSCASTRWVNPDLDAATAKQRLPIDLQLCHEQTDMLVPPIDNNRLYPMDWTYQEQTITYYENYQIYNSRDQVFENCMNLRGWSMPKGPLQVE